MINFKLGEEMRKTECSVRHQHRTNKSSEYPTGIEPMTSRTPVVLNNFIMSCVLQTAGISNFQNILSDDKERKMANFKLGEEIVQK